MANLVGCHFNATWRNHFSTIFQFISIEIIKNQFKNKNPYFSPEGNFDIDAGMGVWGVGGGVGGWVGGGAI